MASSSILSKLNWRLIVIHTIASGFLIYACKVLIYLHDQDFWLKMETIDLVRVDTQRILSNLHLNIYAGLAGLFVGFAISMLLTLKRKWYWANPVIVLLLSFMLLQFNLYGWSLLKRILLFPGSGFGNYTAYIVINGSVMFIAGLLIFFLKPVMRFIDRGANRS